MSVLLAIIVAKRSYLVRLLSYQNGGNKTYMKSHLKWKSTLIYVNYDSRNSIRFASKISYDLHEIRKRNQKQIIHVKEVNEIV